MNTDIAATQNRDERVCDHSVSITVACEILQNKHRKTRESEKTKHFSKLACDSY